VREHVEATATVDFIPQMKEIKTSYSEGSSKQVAMHDGSIIQLQKLAKDWDPQDRHSALNAMHFAKQKGEILTGLLYTNPNTNDLHHLLKTVDEPLNTLKEDSLCPGNKVLQEINAGFR
jgi:2-oxoglutarate ferredoxin oxidoreductase subunit beta